MSNHDIKLRVKIIKEQAELVNAHSVGEQDKLNTIIILCDEILRGKNDQAREDRRIARQGMA